MGISGLLTLLKSITTDVSFSSLSGVTLGIDTYVWLHRGIYGCSTELAIQLDAIEGLLEARIGGAGSGQPIPVTEPRAFNYVRYCEDRLDTLLAHGIKPYFVFDGAPLPAKQGTEAVSRGRGRGPRSGYRCGGRCFVVGPGWAHFIIIDIPGVLLRVCRGCFVDAMVCAPLSLECAP